MATIKLTPSNYYLSNSSYLSVSNATNMYDDTDSTTYATVTNSRTSTSSYYCYVRGFDFSSIPSGAIVNSFTIRIKCNYSGGYSNTMSLYNGTSTAMGSSDSSISSTVATHTFSTSYSWDDIVNAGSDFGIRINCRRSSRNTTSYVYIYGAEIEVDYTIPVSATIVSSLSGNGTILPSGAYQTYEGAEYVLTITPTNASDTVTVTKDGTDVTSQLVRVTGQTVTAVPSNVTTNGVQSGSSYAEYAVGHSAESPSSSGTSSNMYASSSATGYAEYTFDFSDIPSGVEITAIEVRAYGHRESSTIDSTHVSSVTIYQNGTAISDDEDFPSTSNSTVTVTPTTLPSSMSGVTIRHTVGYYGGLVLGISFDVTYEADGVVYTYTYTVDGDATIAVTIGGGSTQSICFKQNGAWVTATKAYKKINGVWVEQQDLTSVFNSSTNYIRG